MAAGLRRGLVEGAVSLTPRGSGCDLSLEVTAAGYSLNWTAAVILGFGGAAACVLLLWPFFPNLLPLAPIAALLAFSSWFLVASRLRSSSPQDYLDDLAANLAAD